MTIPIEKLKELLEKATPGPGRSTDGELARLLRNRVLVELIEARAENERLREALERILQLEGSDTYTSKFVRRALEPNRGTQGGEVTRAALLIDLDARPREHEQVVRCPQCNYFLLIKVQDHHGPHFCVECGSEMAVFEPRRCRCERCIWIPVEA